MIRSVAKIASSRDAGIGARGERLSIMIPTYNCAQYLRQTLESLRDQNDAVAEAEIVIVDDASEKDDPREAAEQSWPGRAEFIRQKRNVGLVANFNYCLERARRPWVHVLHGDDVALPGAYAEFARTTAAVPRVAAIFGRSVFMDGRGFWKGTTPILGPDERGLLTCKSREWITCPVQCAGVMVRRDDALEIGGFDSHFTHVADWNLWWRLARTGRTAYTNRCVGGYRMFEGNHSSSIRRSGTNLRETIEQAGLVIDQCAGIGSVRELWKPIVDRIDGQCRSFVNDPQALRENVSLLDALPAGAVAWRTKTKWRRTLSRLAPSENSRA